MIEVGRPLSDAEIDDQWMELSLRNCRTGLCHTLALSRQPPGMK